MATELNEKLDQIINARDNIQNVLLSKGQVAGTDIRTYASMINNISNGINTDNANVLSIDIAQDKIAFGNNGVVIRNCSNRKSISKCNRHKL